MEVDLLASEDEGMAGDVPRCGRNESFMSHTQILSVPGDGGWYGLYGEDEVVE
jgi:hypothetical protein